MNRTDCIPLWDNRVPPSQPKRARSNTFRSPMSNDDDFWNEAVIESDALMQGSWKPTKRKLQPAKRVKLAQVVDDSNDKDVEVAEIVAEVVPALLPLATYNDIDVSSNPYDEEAEELTGRTSKVHFIDIRDGVKVHEYILQDDKGGYSKLLSSGSKLLDVWKEWNRPEGADEELLEGHRLARAQARSNKDFGGGSLDTIPIVRQLFTDYLNLFCDSPFHVTKEIPYLSFYQRKQEFLGLQETKQIGRAHV